MMENSSLIHDDPDFLLFQRLLFPPVYSLVLVFGLLGNLGALYYFLFQIKQRSPSSVYIVSLAVSDTLFLLSLPLCIHYHLNDGRWEFGETACRVTGTLFFANIYISVAFMTCICVDRYVATLHPHAYLRLRRSRLPALLSAALWLLLGAAALGFMLAAPRPLRDRKCFEAFSAEGWGDLLPYSACSLVFGSLLPSAIILVCYPIVARRISRIRTATARAARRVIYAILALTVLCFLPYNAVHLLHLLARLGHMRDERWIYYLRRVTMALVSLNSLLDPLLYYFATGHYRWRLRRLRLRKRTAVFSVSGGGRSPH